MVGSFCVILTTVRQAVLGFPQVALAIIIKSTWSNTKIPSSKTDDYKHPATCYMLNFIIQYGKIT